MLQLRSFIVFTLIDNSYEPISAREISQLLLNKKFHNLGRGEQKRPSARVLHYLIVGK